jgi:hypothetical protein
MEGENEVVVRVENTDAVVEANNDAAIEHAEIHAEKEIAIAEVQAEAAMAVAEAQAEAAVAIAESQAQPNAEFALIREELQALRNEHAELRAMIESAADDVEESLREEIRAEMEETPSEVKMIDSGETPASVEVAEEIEPGVTPENLESHHKRHFIKL